MPEHQNRIYTLQLALLALFAGLMLTLIAVWWVSDNNKKIIAESLDEESERIIGDVSERLGLYRYALNGIKGSVLSAGGKGLSHNQLEQVSQSFTLTTDFPGAAGMGFVKRVPVDGERAFVQRIREAGFTDFAVIQARPHPGDRYLVMGAVPLDPMQSLFGLDLASFSVLTTAILESQRVGNQRMAPLPKSVAHLGDVIIIQPIYPLGERPQTEQQRWRALKLRH